MWERTVDLSPSEPLVEELALEPGAETITVVVAESSGRELARLCRGPGPEPEVPITLPPHIEPKRAAHSAEGCWSIGLDHERLGEPSEALLHYQQALRLDPAFHPAGISLSILELRRGLIQPALERLRRVLGENPSGPASEGARFHLAAGLLSLERFDDAAFELKTLMRSPMYRPGAAYLLGGILLGRQNPSAALGQLEKCARSFPWHLDALSLSACALRKLNRVVEARERAQRVMREDPLRLLPRAEAYFLGDRGMLAPGGAGKGFSAQHWLELSCEYAQFGMYSEAHELLCLCAADDPLVHYH
ncbi:MAG TPA: tetratricopeptide repeat protein, partial [bacterium]|nr:tetratricopeptide repeat protein [bacterium]